MVGYLYLISCLSIFCSFDYINISKPNFETSFNQDLNSRIPSSLRLLGIKVLQVGKLTSVIGGSDIYYVFYSHHEVRKQCFFKKIDGKQETDEETLMRRILGVEIHYSLVSSLSSFVRLHFCFPTINLSGIGNGTTSCRPRVRSGICMTCLVHLLLRGSRFLAQ